MFPRAVRRPESHGQRKTKLGANPKRANRHAKSEPTFNLLLLPLEGLARLLGLALQAEDSGLLLLEGLAQICVRNADLHQLPVEP
jgi:hypothetical protein